LQAQLETELKGIYQHLEELLGPGEEQELRGKFCHAERHSRLSDSCNCCCAGILQKRTSPTKVQIAAVAAAARRAISPQKVNGNVSSRSDPTNPSTTSRPAKPINYFKGVLTKRDLVPKTVFMSPAKQDLVREQQYFPEEYVWEDSAGGGENKCAQKAGAEAHCADGRKGSWASPRKVDWGHTKHEIPPHRRAKVSDRADSIVHCMLARFQLCV
jgi:hypothetical protein